MSGVCFDWQNKGFCSRANCRFRHLGPGGQGRGRGGQPGRYGGRPRRWMSSSSQGGSVPPRMVGQNIRHDTTMKNFIRALSVYKAQKLGEELTKNKDLWRRCWQNQDILDDVSRKSMMEILAKTPGSSSTSVSPPPIQPLEIVSIKFLDQEAKSSASADQVLTTVKTIKNVLETVLQFEWGCTREQVVQVLSRIVLLAESKLRKQNKDHRETASELMMVLEDMEKPWRIQIKQDQNETAASGWLAIGEPVKYDDWKNPTIEWLCTPTFFAPSCCPKMKVGQVGFYESAED